VCRNARYINLKDGLVLFCCSLSHQRTIPTHASTPIRQGDGGACTRRSPETLPVAPYAVFMVLRFSELCQERYLNALLKISFCKRDACFLNK
jgi:hypothetical protein